MQVSSSFALWSLILALPVCLYIFYADMKFKRISNTAVWALFAVFVVTGLTCLPFMEFFWRLANYAVVFSVLFLMWLLRQMGAGDVKMAAVSALFVDRADTADVMWIAFAAIIAATLATVIVRFTPLRHLAPDWAAWRLRPSEDGVSVGKGAQMTLPMGTGIGLMLCTYLLLGALHGI
jgi:prepilin peptidase CpaA